MIIETTDPDPEKSKRDVIHRRVDLIVAPWKRYWTGGEGGYFFSFFNWLS